MSTVTAPETGLPYDRADAERVLRDVGLAHPQMTAANYQVFTASHVIRDRLASLDDEQIRALPPGTVGGASALWRLFRTVDLAGGDEYEGIIYDDRDPTLADAMVLLLKVDVVTEYELPAFANAVRSLGLPEMARIIESANAPV